MKRLILISASVLLASASFAQNGSSDNSLYKFDNAGSPKEVSRLGSAPEFPMLRNMQTPGQVYRAIKKHENDNTMAMRKLNDLLMQVGYTNGAKDLEQSDITEAYIAPGTEGNMGSRGYTYSYTRLSGNPSEFKAWKIAPNGNGYSPLYLFAKCGNAFYPKSAAKTACVNVPVNLKPDMNQVTLPSSGTKVTTKDKVFVYYERKHHRKHDQAYPVAGLNAKYPSSPIMVSSEKDEQIMPETYTVSLTSPESSVTACADSTLNLTANINVEKTSSYTGNYPNDNQKEYKKVSKHHYRQIARRMRRIHRKEEKIARKTGVPVDVRTTAKA